MNSGKSWVKWFGMIAAVALGIGSYFAKEDLKAVVCGAAPLSVESGN